MKHLHVKTDTKAGGFWESTNSWMNDTKDKTKVWRGTVAGKAGDVWEDMSETWDKYF